MFPKIESESTLTDRYQTTVPGPVRRALGLNKRDRIHYTVRDNGEVVLTRAEAETDDPLLGRFLAFLGADLAAHPERLQAMDPALVDRVNALTDGVDIDLDAPLPPDD